jgi:D-alanyl-D-alanine carboxypeptidase
MQYNVSAAAREDERKSVKRPTTLLVLSLVITALALSSCGKSDSGTSSDALPRETQRRLDEIVDDAMARDGIPGAIVGVWAPGRGTWVAVKGQADISPERAMQAGDRYRIGDVTATFTSTVVLQLVDEGRVKLDDSLQVYFPGAPQVAGITVRQLLNHTSGLFDYRDDEAFQGVMKQQPGRRWSPEELVGIAFTHPAEFPPGQEFHYSDTDYIILGLLVEATTASDLEEEVNRRVIDRLGLINTYFIHNPAMAGQYSHGYLQTGGGTLQDVSNTYDPSWVWAAGAMTSNQDDLAAYARSLANGDLISRAAQRERLQTVPADLNGSRIYYGLGIVSWQGFLGHTGYYPGYDCAVFYHPVHEATIVVFFNRTTPGTDSAAQRVFQEIAETLYPTSS